MGLQERLYAAIPSIRRGVVTSLLQATKPHQPAPLVFVFTRSSMLFAVM